MMIPTYDQVLDFADGFWGRFKKGSVADKQLTSSKAAILKEVTEKYDNIVGRFDTLERIPSRRLITPQSDQEKVFLTKHGAVEGSDGVWTVPDEIELGDTFELWYPPVPHDLRDTTPRLLKTRDGNPIESYVRPEDSGKGADSTATSLMYGGIALVSGICYLLASIWFPLIIVGALLYIPFIVALSQGESRMEAAKAGILLGIAPLMFAFGSASEVYDEAKSLLPGGGNGFIAAVILAVLGSFVLNHFDKNRKASVMGGAFDKLISIMIWSAVFVACYFASRLLPASLQPFLFLSLPCFYPMIYTDANHVRRGKLLWEQSLQFNIGGMGALSSAHVESKHMQAKKAQQDTTPLLVIGTATGWLTKKHYPFAPDEGVEMCLSALDLTKHLLCYGQTGSGKSTGVARPIAKQWILSRYGGFLCLDGKGALPGELSSLIEVMIAPGISYAPFQGLDGHGIATALNSAAKAVGAADAKNAVWTEGASDLIRYAAVIFEALHQHERVYLKYAADMANLKELDIDAALVSITRMQQSDDDTTEAIKALEKLKSDFEGWATVRDTGRKWLWNVDTYIKVLNMISEPVMINGMWMPGKLLSEAVEFLGYTENEMAAESRRRSHQTTVHPEIGTRGLLDDALVWVLKTWTQGTEPQQRSSFLINARLRILPITTGKYLLNENGQHWKTLETGVDAGICLYGGSVGVHLPEERHQEAGVLIATLLKQRIYNSVALRGGEADWTADGQKPLMVMMDECQDLISSAERMLLPKARSLGLTVVALSQGWEGLENKLGGKMEALQFCNTFQNYVCLRSSAQTYMYLAERFGTAQMLSYKQPIVGLDISGGIKKLATSPINNLKHPNRSVMRKLERLGAGRLAVQRFIPGKASLQWQGHSLINIEDDEITKDIRVPHGGTLEIQPLFLPEEFSALTTFGKAIVFLDRAGERRVDVATLNPVYESELRKKEKDKEPALEEA